MYYCLCGQVPIQTSVSSFRFRCCCKDQHGKEYTSFNNLPQIDIALQEVKRNVITILLFGGTGVGKTTLVNSLANYLKHSRFETMYNNLKDLVCLAKVQYNYPAPDGTIVTVTVPGLFNNDECVGTSAASHTRRCSTYIMYWGHVIIKLIDTPGMEDTRGEDQYDGMNIENIMAYLSQYKIIHCFMFLVKANESRLKDSLRKCFKHLITKLDKNALKNIIFVCTYGRGPRFLPGDTEDSLKELLKSEKVDIALDHSVNIFTLENDSFKWLVQIRDGMPDDNREYNQRMDSWAHSSGKCNVMFSRIYAVMEAHNVTDSLSLFYVSRLFDLLAHPLGVILEIIKRDSIELENSLKENNYEDFLEVEQTNFRVEELPTWRTVCTHSTCSSRHYTHGGTEVRLYRHICELSSTAINTDEHGGQGRHIVSGSQLFRPRHDQYTACSECGHFSPDHIVTNIQYHKECCKQWVLRYEIQQRLKEFKIEMEKILSLGAFLSKFLSSRTAGVYFSDSLEKVINLQLKILETDTAIFQEFNQVKEQYVTTRDSVNTEDFNIKQVFEKINELYEMPVYGSLIKQSVALQCKIHPIPIGMNDSLISTPKHESFGKKAMKALTFRQDQLCMRNGPPVSPLRPSSVRRTYSPPPEPDIPVPVPVVGDIDIYKYGYLWNSFAVARVKLHTDGNKTKVYDATAGIEYVITGQEAAVDQSSMKITIHTNPQSSYPVVLKFSSQATYVKWVDGFKQHKRYYDLVLSKRL